MKKNSSVNFNDLDADMALFMMGVELLPVEKEEEEEAPIAQKTRQGKGHHTRLYGREEAMKDHQHRGTSRCREKRLFESGVLDKGSTFNDRKRLEKYDLDLEDEDFTIEQEIELAEAANFWVYGKNWRNRGRGIQYFDDDIHPEISLPNIKVREDYACEILAKARELLNFIQEAGYNICDEQGDRVLYIYDTKYLGLGVNPGWFADGNEVIK